jgi:acyl-CoA synthetase (AMP-forming)/AMP-acid ligase II
MEFNFADIYEAIADRVPERTALVTGDVRTTYAELDEMANRLAHHLQAQGVGEGDHVGCYLLNGPEYLATFFAALKIRAVPINVNFRYVADELRYLFDDAGLKAVVFHQQFLPRVEEIAGEVPSLTTCIVVDDGSDEQPSGAIDVQRWDAVLAAASPERDFGPRSGDDHYVLYTGGTTGMPKGVVWRQEDAFYGCIGGGDALRIQGQVSSVEELFDRIGETPFSFLPVAPLMHAAAQWTTLMWLFAGGKVVLMPGSMEPEKVWDAIDAEGVNLITVVGDAVVRPLMDAWDAGGAAERWDIGTLFSIGSGGAPLSPAMKLRMAEAFPDVIIADGFGSSETGIQGSHRVAGKEIGDGKAHFSKDDNTVVVADDLTLVAPGSGVVGRVGQKGRVPIGYHNDPEKTAKTFVEVDGERVILSGDMATVDADGAVTLLGRGSVCINTGGEKVYPEEVEGVLKAHPSVYDAVVVGVPDERWGERVSAVVQLVPGTSLTEEEAAAHAREALAGYKVPRALTLVDVVVRSPAGKADYRWAKQVAIDGA